MIIINIKETRKKVGLSQVEAEKYIGVPHRTWQDLELGKRTPPDYVERLIIEKLLRYKESKDKK